MNTDFGRSLLSQMGIAAVFALSFNVLFGQTGLLSFGHAVYFGLGGYAAIHFMRAINHGLPIPIPLVPLAGAAAGLLFGILLGSVTTRRAGTIFALISLGVGELVYAAMFMLPGYFGGEEGITASRTRAPHLLGLDFGSQLEVYYVIAVWALVAALADARLHAHARGPHVQRRPGQSGACRIRRLQHAARAVRRVCRRRPVRRAGGRPPRDQLRDRCRGRGRARSAPARCC